MQGETFIWEGTDLGSALRGRRRALGIGQADAAAGASRLTRSSTSVSEHAMNNFRPALTGPISPAAARCRHV